MEYGLYKRVAILLLILTFPCFLLYEFFKKDFDENLSGQILVNENIVSRVSKEKIIDSLNLDPKEYQIESYQTNSNLESSILKIQDYSFEGLLGLLSLVFYNNELATVTFEPKNYSIFLENFTNMHPELKEKNELSTTSQYVQVSIKHDKVKWADTNMMKKYVWYLRRYGSD